MFFFFFGGVRQHVSEVLEREVSRCLRCGYPADKVNYDNVLEVFFLPVWRWPAKNPGLHCSNCGFLVPYSVSSSSSVLPPSARAAISADSVTCWSCSKTLDRSFKFCPFCGSPQEF